MQTLTNVTKLSYHELDKLVNQTWDGWKGRFESVAEFEWNNEEEHLIEGVGITCFNQAEATENAKEWAKGKRPFCSGEHQLMEALYVEGAIEAGNYIIEVWW